MPNPISATSSLRFFLFGNLLNSLLIVFPIGIISAHLKWNPVLTFTFNFLALIPLSKLLGTATEEIALHTSSLIGGLLTATFGNAIELIISILALRNDLITLVQSSLTGSILSNLLLVAGASFFAGGMYYKEQSFNVTGAQTAASLLVLSVLSMMIPAAFDVFVDGSNPGQEKNALSLSRGTSVILLIVYGMYIYFQLRSHSYLYASDHSISAQPFVSRETEESIDQSEGQLAVQIDENKVEEEREEPSMLFSVAFVCLVIITILVTISSDALVESVEGLSDDAGISKSFIGLILVPIVGNAAEHLTAVTVAMKNKMDLSIGIAIGSSTQIALFVSPLIVVLGWMMDKPMTLDFHPFQTITLFTAVFMTNSLIQDGKSHWLEGAMLIASYLIISLAFFYLPDKAI